jgi:hypothetical protein
MWFSVIRKLQFAKNLIPIFSQAYYEIINKVQEDILY